MRPVVAEAPPKSKRVLRLPYNAPGLRIKRRRKRRLRGLMWRKGALRHPLPTNGLEAWRRLATEYDPMSSMRRVVILGQVQNPPKCDKIEDLGAALEDWLAKKRRYEEFTDSEGNPCRVSSDSLMAAMYKDVPRHA